ncbi:hypothetical protein AGMMS49975_03020 [Clostridia bacterium]|nr:hypothetical protein AGMMS49975_03020 [Clostridia bacterium]
MSDKNGITIETNIKGLKSKINTRIDPYSDTLFWFIRFNVQLDESTVTEQTMRVTDTDGYVMRTDISYNDAKQSIMISPLDSYEQGVFYMLRISKKVRSKKGRALGTQVNILFKLHNNKISEFKTLMSNVIIPKEQKRPSNYDEMFRAKIQREREPQRPERAETASRVYSFDDKPFKEAGAQGQLPTEAIKINVIPGIAGIVIALMFFIVKVVAVLIVGIVISVLGIIYISTQLSDRKNRSIIWYNKGVSAFNAAEYRTSLMFFKKAIDANPDNEKAEYALNKVTFYTINS